MPPKKRIKPVDVAECFIRREADPSGLEKRFIHEDIGEFDYHT
jgi:hypothetical protein